MASGVGSSLKPTPLCRPTNGGTDFLLVSSWRSSDVAGFRLADQPERRQAVSLRLRASASQIQEAAHCSNGRKPGRLSRRSVLGFSAISIQPVLAWSSNADAQELNESQKIFQAFLESVRERLKRTPAVPPEPSPPTLEDAASSEPQSGAQSAPESASQSPESAVESPAQSSQPPESAVESPAETASEASEQGLTASESSDSESLEPSQAGEKFEPAESAPEEPLPASPEPEESIERAAKGETAETYAPAGEAAPSEEPVSASAESGDEETKAAAAADGEIAAEQESVPSHVVSDDVEKPAVAAPVESPAADSSAGGEPVLADSETPTSAEFAQERAYDEPLESFEPSPPNSVPSDTGDSAETAVPASESVVPEPAEEAFTNLAQKVEEASASVSDSVTP